VGGVGGWFLALRMFGMNEGLHLTDFGLGGVIAFSFYEHMDFVFWRERKVQPYK